MDHQSIAGCGCHLLASTWSHSHHFIGTGICISVARNRLSVSTLLLILQLATFPGALETRIIVFWESTGSFSLLESKQ